MIISATPTDPTQLMNLPYEILLAILKASPNFDTLLSLIQAKSDFYALWKANQYAICQSVAKNILGPLWPDAYGLLVFQGRLKRQEDPTPDIRSLFTGIYSAVEETGWGVLEGGTHIGTAELYQLLRYIDKINYWRASLHSSLNTTNMDGGDWVECNFTVECEFVINRAFFRYWVILLATAPQLISHNDELTWAIHQGQEMVFLSSVYNISDDEITQKRLKEFRAVEPFLRYQGREQELIELAKVAEDSWAGGLISLPGLAEEGGAHYYSRWVRERELQCQALRHIWCAVSINSQQQEVRR